MQTKTVHTNEGFDGMELGRGGGLGDNAKSALRLNAGNLKLDTNGKEKSKGQLNQDEPNALDGALDIDEGVPWKAMSSSEKRNTVLMNLGKFFMVMVLLYLFICSLDFLQASFRLIAGKSTGGILNGDFVSNPIVGLMIGILVTVLVQSSSTSTSIIVSMVSSGLLNVEVAIPMIIGSNIGTSVTSTLVSLTQAGDREEFRRAFAGATVHDMFNWLNVIVMLTLEICFGFLHHITDSIMNSFNFTGGNGGGEIKILKYLTEPLTKVIIKTDKSVITAWGVGKDQMYMNMTSMIQRCYDNCTHPLIDSNCKEIDCDPWFLFSGATMSDTVIGIILLVGSLTMLSTCLIGIVKVLNSVMKGSVAKMLKKTLNADIPYVPWLTGYVAMLIGAFMTFILQSSSVFTSTLTPLIGIGLITVERAYPLTLGSNIGTTSTTILASLAGEGETLRYSIQIALVHLFFNLFGIAMFYPVPFMRFPIRLAKALGDITATYRWFAILYLFGMFFIVPALVFLLSLGGRWAVYIVGLPLLLLLIFVAVINILQAKKPEWLPKILTSWDFLPEPLHSLEPYDKLFTKLMCLKSCQAAAAAAEESGSQSNLTKQQEGFDNPAMDNSDERNV